jgi:Protein of unknown function (DUF3429)
MPISAILLSILGLAPFIGCGLTALGPNAVTADHMLTALLAWGALVLSFVSGLHWGLVLRETEVAPVAPVPAAPGPGAPGTAVPEPTVRGSLPWLAAPGRQRHARIGVAVLPLILGWVALLLPLVAAPWLGLLLLIAAYIATLSVEHRLAGRLALPAAYVWSRWGFTIVAVAMMTTVVTLRLLGQTIVL